MIELIKTGDCIDCPGMDLEVGTLYFGDEKRQNVFCKNEKLCRRLKEIFEEREARQKK